MITESALERYLVALLEGSRTKARSIIEEVLQTGTTINSVYFDVIWPMMVELEKLLRAERISPAQEHMAVRINRTIIDQLQNKLPRKSRREKKIVICCADNETQELGAQMMADLFESDGWDVKFLGGGLNNDDILSFIHTTHPDILLIYGTTPRQAPCVRKLIDTIKSVNAYPNMAIMVSGGLFNRAEGLWEEIGADLFAATANEAIIAAGNFDPTKKQSNRTIKTRNLNTPFSASVTVKEIV